MATQTLGETLVGVQPVWNPREVPDVALVTLKIAVKSRPVVAEKQPGHATAAKSRVSMLSVGRQLLPFTMTPLRHSNNGVGLGKIEPVRSAPAGVSIP